MTDTKRRIEITVERQRILVVKRRRGAMSVRCKVCDGQPQMHTLDEAARLLGISERDICRRVEGGLVHFNEPADGALLICCSSLYQSN